jgi:hypothetical protein
MSATQGGYSREQFLLDITQGARVSSSAYPTAFPPVLSLRSAGAGAIVAGWGAAGARANAAPQLLRPGLLAAQIPEGAAYAGIEGLDDIDGVVAAERTGHISAISLGSAPTLLARLAALREQRRFVVADLPGDAQGDRDLRTLDAERTPGELLIVLQRASGRPGDGHELLWAALAGLSGGGGRELSSQTTKQRGLIAAVDLAPTILRRLGLRAIPPDMRGEPITTAGSLESQSLSALMARLRVVAGRRLKALGILLCAWLALLLASAIPSPARSLLSGAWAMRAGALGVLWTPVVVLITAALEPSAAVEYATIAVGCLMLGALTDVLLRWPHALLAPAIVGVLALLVDALAGTQLLMRSLLGPDPILGARFYGIGNELKSGLAVLVLAALAAALHPAQPGRRAVLAVAGTGIALGVVEGSARIGAGVGGVILVAAGFAVAAVMMGDPRSAWASTTRRRAPIVLLAPLAGLVALAALDLATAHGGGHFTGSVLDVRSAADARDIIVRRYSAAFDELENHMMPLATAFALLCAGLGLRGRERILRPVEGGRAWLAALAGGLTAGIVGALAEDSGPVLLVVAVFTLGCVLTYLWGRPDGSSSGSPASMRRAGGREASSLKSARRPGTLQSSSTRQAAQAR